MDKPQLSEPHQRISMMIVVVIGVTTLIFGVIALNKSIYLPFVRQPSAVVFKTDEQLKQEQMEALKHKDTDGDGLTDYDELYIYHTSPFLADSDSDGIPDGVEVSRGTDPNCPEGQTCREPRTTNPGPTTDFGTAAQGTAPETGAADQTAGQTAENTNAAPASPVSTASDSQILQIITDTFGDVSGLTENDNVNKEQQLPTDKLRAFYVKLGLPESEVQKVDDATLRQLLLDTFKQLNSGAGGTNAAPK